MRRVTTVSEQFCKVGEVELCYETCGDQNDPAMLLIMGLARNAARADRPAKVGAT